MIYIKKYTINSAPSFEKEFKRLYENIASKLKEPVIAKKFYDKITKTIYSLRYFPERYVKIYGFKNNGRNLRRLSIDNYIIIYEIINNTRTSFYLTYLP